MKEYVVTVDIARKNDFFNIQAGRIVPEITPGSSVLGTPDRIIHYLDVVYIDKFQRVTYDEGADRVEKVVNHRELKGNCDLVVDGTGIGDAVVEILRKRGLNPVPIIFTSGTSVREVFGAATKTFRLTPGDHRLQTMSILEEIHVPKDDLVAAGKMLIERGRLRVAPGLRWRGDFRAQLEAFRGKVNERTGRVKYEAETEEAHDDEVVCYLMMAWWMGRLTRQVKAPEGPMIKAEERLEVGEPYMEERA